jgi:hypothetical protein
VLARESLCSTIRSYVQGPAGCKYQAQATALSFQLAIKSWCSTKEKWLYFTKLLGFYIHQLETEMATTHIVRQASNVERITTSDASFLECLSAVLKISHSKKVIVVQTS